MQRRVWSIWGVAALLVALAPPSFGSDGDEVPFGCESVDGTVRCPDLTIDATRAADARVVIEHVAPDSCEALEGLLTPGMHRLLRFTFTAPNLGPGDLVAGDPAAQPERFTWHACHRHYHLEAFAVYRLWQPADYAQWSLLRASAPEAPASALFEEAPELEQRVVGGAKAGFCLRDTRVYVSAEPRFLTCDDQGITRGWADEYPWHISMQFVVVDDVAPGAYVLDLEVDPERIIGDVERRNDAVALPVVLA